MVNKRGWDVVRKCVLKKKNSFKWRAKLTREGSLVFTWSDMESSITGQELRDKCIKDLTDVGAPNEFSQFFAELLQCEYEVNIVVHKIHQSLDNEKNDVSDPQPLLKGIQDLTKNYNMWQHTIDSLTQRGSDIPGLIVDKEKLAKSKHIKALCSVHTNEINLNEGDDVTITDTTRPNRFKIKTSVGQEGYVPALSCILPAPDKNASSATQRLRVELLASWTESVKKMQSLLHHCLSLCSQKLITEWKSHAPTSSSSNARERISRRFKRFRNIVSKNSAQQAYWQTLHNAIFSLERELSQLDSNGSIGTINSMVSKIATLDKAVLCYQMFRKQWQVFRQSLEQAAKPIRVVDHWEQLRPVGKQRPVRYFEVKMTVEDTETVEEIIYEKRPEGTESTSESWSSNTDSVETDQITSTQQEEKRRFVIRAVLDPRSGEEISIMDAIKIGIVDQNRGLYVNPNTGDSMPIPEAMNTGKIKVEFTTATKSQEEKKAVGLITIRTRTSAKNYEISKVIDANTGERLVPEEAKKRGILDEENEVFVNSNTKEKISLANAIHCGWVIAEFDDNGDDGVETKMYAVSAVVDQKLKKKVPFYEAVCSGLLDKESGNYINNVTGERIYVTEAIKRGFLKAREIEDTKGLNIEAENKVVVERMDKMRKNVLKSVGVLNAFKKAAMAKK